MASLQKLHDELLLELKCRFLPGLARRGRLDSDREMSQLHVNILKLLQVSFSGVPVSIGSACFRLRRLQDM